MEDVDLIQTLREEYFEKILCQPFNYEERSEDPDIQSIGEINQWTPKPEPLEASRDAIPPVNQVQLERKPLLKHLRYSFLGEGETMPVVISSDLAPPQEEPLLQLLRRHKQALGWSISDLHGISLLICTHRIFVEENTKPLQQMQKRLNPNMKDVVQGEVLKLLDADIIYPISDSKWISPTQVVPKKSTVTIIANENNELIPTHIQTGWCMCIDYRKLNTVTRKDHFPLPFLDQVLERVAGHAFYFFFMGFLGTTKLRSP